MEIQVVGSTKINYNMPIEEALDFSGKAAGICYMPDTIETLFNEDKEKTNKRINRTLISGHHSVFDHPMYNLVLIDIPKILAMILNNEGMYTTSEKSARYTKMRLSEKEKELYEKWIEIYSKEISKVYPNIIEKQILKLAQENARYLISIFTPSTTMEYTVSLRQINYIIHWFEDYIKQAEDTPFNLMLKPYLKEFIEKINYLYVPELNSNEKERTISLFSTRQRKEEFGENYCTTYEGTFAQFAQAQRHRTLNYEIEIMENNKVYVPKIIQENEKLVNEWEKDMKSVIKNFPQGLIININERGTLENFILKCKERLCGAAQLEIMEQTKKTLDKYIENTKETNNEAYNYLEKYKAGIRCKFPNWKCKSPCIWGSKNALTRKI